MVSTEDAVVGGDVQSSDRESIEHVMNTVDDGSTECVLMPADCDPAIASEWIAAQEGSYVSRKDAR